MKSQQNRLPADAPRGFSGAGIDRGRPLHFRLDGRVVSGFAGDTVLSAALASGIDTIGLHQDTPIGLTMGSAPAISYASVAGDPQQALPMARTPAIDGADLVTLGGKRLNPFARLFLPGRTLGLDLDGPHVLDRPWRGAAGQPRSLADLLVIGGGVAGLSAALAGARAGLAVTLLESSPQLGGHSGLFGTQEGEDAPEVSMARLRDSVMSNDAITTLTSAHAYAIRPNLVRFHHVERSDGMAKSKVYDQPARYIVIATGSRERLPIFAGNRLPGVIGTLDAYELAVRYGVWVGRTSVFSTASNFAYRLAMLASDVGVSVHRILDSRAGAASRFIEFSRAYGMVQVPGTSVDAVEISRTGGSLRVATSPASAEPFTTERLLVSGGWQPDLTLWHVSGGSSRWHEAHHRLEPEGEVDGIMLAGSAAGYMTRRGCIQSGADAIDALLGRARRPVEDPAIDPIYETPDAAIPIAPPRTDASPTYLDDGSEFLQRPQPAPKSWINAFRRTGARRGLTALSETPQPLTINEVAAGVALGLIPSAAAGVVAQERVALVPLATAEPEALREPPVAPEPAEVPPYLVGRFGPNAHVVKVVPAEQRRLDTGALIYASADKADPLSAIGVILRPHDGGATALVAAAAAQRGLAVTVRDHGRMVAASIELGGLSSG